MTQRTENDILTPHVINATTIDDAWHQCLFKLIDEGWVFHVDRGSYEGTKDEKGEHRLQFGSITLRIKFPGQEPRLPVIAPDLNIPPPVADGYVEDYLPYLLTSAIKPDEEYTYGQYIHGWEYYELRNDVRKVPRMFQTKIVNQFQKVVKMLKNNPGTNQAIMTIGNPQSILLKNPPCLRSIQAMIICKQLHFYPVFRSWDLWGGTPANLAAIQVLKELMLFEINEGKEEKDSIEDGQIIAFSPGMHIYEYVWNLAERVSRIPEGTIAEKHKDEMRK